MFKRSCPDEIGSTLLAPLALLAVNIRIVFVVVILVTGFACAPERWPEMDEGQHEPVTASRATTADAAPAPPPPAQSPALRGERALWALQERLAAAGAPLRREARLPAGTTRADVRPVRVRLDARGPTWTARLSRCEVPRDSDCAGRWEDGVCECTVLVLEARGEQRSLVVAESAGLGRPRLAALPRPGGGMGLWLAADLYDRRTPWPRVGFLVEGPVPRLAWRGELGSCVFEVRGDPEDERAPSTCSALERDARYGPDDALVVELASGPRSVSPARP